MEQIAQHLTIVMSMKQALMKEEAAEELALTKLEAGQEPAKTMFETVFDKGLHV